MSEEPQAEGPDIGFGIHALRTFAMVRDRAGEVHLRSLMARRADWMDGTARARCLAWDPQFAYWSPGVVLPAHEAPDARCSCGIYGALTLAHLQDQYPDFTSGIVAVIAPEGKTMMGPVGLRTARARVVAYWGTRPHRRVARSQFGDAQGFRNIDKMLQAYGLERGERTYRRALMTADWWNQGQAPLRDE